MGLNVDHEVIAKFTGEVGKHDHAVIKIDFFDQNCAQFSTVITISNLSATQNKIRNRVGYNFEKPFNKRML